MHLIHLFKEASPMDKGEDFAFMDGKVRNGCLQLRCSHADDDWAVLQIDYQTDSPITAVPIPEN